MKWRLRCKRRATGQRGSDCGAWKPPEGGVVRSPIPTPEERGVGQVSFRGSVDGARSRHRAADGRAGLTAAVVAPAVHGPVRGLRARMRRAECEALLAASETRHGGRFGLDRDGEANAKLTRDVRSPAEHRPS